MQVSSDHGSKNGGHFRCHEEDGSAAFGGEHSDNWAMFDVRRRIACVLDCGDEFYRYKEMIGSCQVRGSTWRTVTDNGGLDCHAEGVCSEDWNTFPDAIQCFSA